MYVVLFMPLLGPVPPGWSSQIWPWMRVYLTVSATAPLYSDCAL